MKSTRRSLGWLWALLIQAAAMAAASALTTLCLLLPASWVSSAYACLNWIFLPALGLLLGYFATRRGLSNYLAWLLPPIAHAVTPIFLVGYPPAPAPVLLNALLSLIGAAAGDVRNKSARRKA